MHKTLSTLTVVTCCALLAAGCDFIKVMPDPDDPVSETDRYKADLHPLNAVGDINAAFGETIFNLTENRFSVRVAAAGLAPGITHAQHVHAAAVCPPPEADVNEDGYIDIMEGVPFYGAILIPLDGNLREQAAGADGFPMANENGKINYAASTSRPAMLANLRATDPNPDDPIVKLGHNEELDIEGRTVVLHGVAPDTPLPSTVATIAGLPPQATLPVACGDIVSAPR